MYLVDAFFVQLNAEVDTVTVCNCFAKPYRFVIYFRWQHILGPFLLQIGSPSLIIILMTIKRL